MRANLLLAAMCFALLSMAAAACDSASGEITLEAVLVGDDTNKDGKLSAGEIGYLAFRLTNPGSSDVTSANGTLTSDSQYVQILENAEFYCGQVNAGGAAECPNYYSSGPKVEIAPNTPDGEAVPFVLHVNAGEGSWSIPFSIEIEAADVRLEVDTLQVYDENEDGAPSPGETVRVGLTLKNTGSAGVKEANARVHSDSDYVTITDEESQYCGQIDAGKSKQCAQYEAHGTQIVFSETTPIGETIDFRVFVTDAAAGSWTLIFQLQVVATGARVELVGYTAYVGGSEVDSIKGGDSVSFAFEFTNTGTGDAVEPRGEILSDSADFAVVSGAEFPWSTSRFRPGDTTTQPSTSYRPEVEIAAAPTPGEKTLTIWTYDDYGGAWSSELKFNVN